MNMSLNEQNFEKAYIRAVKYVSYRARTSHELYVFLLSKGVSEHDVEKIITRFKENLWLDDTEYARRFIEQSLKHKSKGKTWIRQALIRKGIDMNVIHQVLQEIDDDCELAEAVSFARKKWVKAEPSNIYLTQKLFQSMTRRGYSIEIIKKALHQLKIEIELP